MAYGDLARWIHENSNRGALENFLNEDRPFKTPFDLRRRGPSEKTTGSNNEIEKIPEKEITYAEAKDFYHLLNKHIAAKLDDTKFKKTCFNHIIVTKEEMASILNKLDSKTNEFAFEFLYQQNKPKPTDQIKKEFDEYIRKENTRIARTNKVHYCSQTQSFLYEAEIKSCNSSFGLDAFFINPYCHAMNEMAGCERANARMFRKLDSLYDRGWAKKLKCERSVLL